MRTKLSRLLVAGLFAGTIALIGACEVDNGEPVQEDEPFAPTEQEGDLEDDGFGDDGLDDDTDDDF